MDANLDRCIYEKRAKEGCYDDAALGRTAADVARVHGGLADMVDVEHPAKEAFETETESTMRAGSESTLVVVPEVIVLLEVVRLVVRPQPLLQNRTHSVQDW